MLGAPDLSRVMVFGRVMLRRFVGVMMDNVMVVRFDPNQVSVRLRG
jgi:hypothetical protein